jgi:hypothetical protein
MSTETEVTPSRSDADVSGTARTMSGTTASSDMRTSGTATGMAGMSGTVPGASGRTTGMSGTSGTAFDSGVTDTTDAGTATEGDVGRFARRPTEGEAGPRGDVGGTSFGTSTAGADLNRTTNAGGTTFGDYQHGNEGHRVRRWTWGDGGDLSGEGTSTMAGGGTYDTSSGFSGGADQFEQWRGRDLYGSDGDKVGTVNEIYVDEATGQAEWLGLDTGFLGTKRVVVPYRSASMSGDRFQVPFTKDQVKDAPGVDDEQIGEDQERELCTYFGVDYSHSASPTGMAGQAEGGFTSRHRRWWGERAA